MVVGRQGVVVGRRNPVGVPIQCFPLRTTTAQTTAATRTSFVISFVFIVSDPFNSIFSFSRVEHKGHRDYLSIGSLRSLRSPRHVLHGHFLSLNINFVFSLRRLRTEIKLMCIIPPPPAFCQGGGGRVFDGYKIDKIRLGIHDGIW